jgi:hypothetical protein
MLPRTIVTLRSLPRIGPETDKFGWVFVLWQVCTIICSDLELPISLRGRMKRIWLRFQLMCWRCAGALSVGCAGALSVGCAGALSVGCAGPLSVGCAGPLSVGCAGALSVGCAGPLSVGYSQLADMWNDQPDCRYHSGWLCKEHVYFFCNKEGLTGVRDLFGTMMGLQHCFGASAGICVGLQAVKSAGDITVLHPT